MTTTSNVCCGIEQISKHFTKEIKITIPVLEARKWSRNPEITVQGHQTSQ